MPVLTGTVMLETERLLLRRWKESDREPFARMNADPRIMRYFPKLLLKEESDRMVDHIAEWFENCRFGLYAVELRGPESPFIGFIGLAIPGFDAFFTPCVEIGWRLAADYWNRGLATEGARAVVRHAFDVLGLDALVSFTAAQNIPSRRVMEKIGMIRNPAEDFNHRNLPEGHPLRPHVLYRLSKATS